MRFELTTFVFELVNFMVLLWLLHRLLYRPLRAAIERRRQAIADREHEAEERLQRAETREREQQERAAGIEELRRKTLRAATDQAAEERARMLAQAREDAEAEREHARRLVDAEREAAIAWVREVAIERSTDLAGRLLEELAPTAIDGALLDGMLAEVGRRSADLRAESGVAGDGAAPEVDVSFARLPDDAAAAKLRQALHEALGRAPRLALHEDPALGAGAVLRVGSSVLDASIAGHLAAFRERARQLVQAAEEGAA